MLFNVFGNLTVNTYLSHFQEDLVKLTQEKNTNPHLHAKITDKQLPKHYLCCGKRKEQQSQKENLKRHMSTHQHTAK